MTVIAYKDGVVAADTQTTWGTSRVFGPKLVRLPCGGVAGGAGDASASQAALNWLASGGSLDGSEGKAFVPNIEGADVLIAKGDGTLWMLTSRFPAWPVNPAPVAIGCGSDAALIAMSLGLSAVEACQRVALHDVYCGSPIQSMEVEPTHEYSGAKTHRKRK
jgi:hypothetical protein